MWWLRVVLASVTRVRETKASNVAASGFGLKMHKSITRHALRRCHGGVVLDSVFLQLFSQLDHLRPSAKHVQRDFQPEHPDVLACVVSVIPTDGSLRNHATDDLLR
jgi:hypothetical protein